MNPLVLRAELLINQQRYAQAVDVLRDALASDPENATVHSYLAISLSQVGQYDSATTHAEQAIELAPDDPLSHFSLAWGMVERRRWPEARRAIDAAIALAPHDARHYWMLSRIHFCENRWQQALTAAEQGLQADPDHQGCMHMQGVARLVLGQKIAAAEAIGQSLAKKPESAAARASSGWLSLTQNRPREAMDSFRESLRLDPTLEWARRGMVEALKSRHWFYRAIMRLRTAPQLDNDSASVWRSIQWRFVRLNMIAGWVLSLMCCLAMPIPAIYADPPPPPLYWVAFAIGLFCFLGVALAAQIGNLFLLSDRWGRHVLNEDEIHGARLLAASPLLPAIGCAAAIVSGDMTALAAGLMLSIVAVPISFLYRCDPGWPRQVAGLIIVGLIALGCAAAWPSGETSSLGNSRALPVIALLYGTFLGSCALARLSRVEPKR